jgi:hypothetical protein
LIENNKILLSKQFDGYDFPGGGVNLDETLEETCAREFLADNPQYSITYRAESVRLLSDSQLRIRMNKPHPNLEKIIQDVIIARDPISFYLSKKKMTLEQYVKSKVTDLGFSLVKQR